MDQVRRQLGRAIWLLPVAVFIGCSRVSPPQPGTDLNCLVYDGGAPVRTVALKKDEANWKVIVEVLGSKRDRWNVSSVSYAPRILVRAGDTSWNFQKGLVIVNFKDGEGKLRQVTRPLSDAEF